MEGLFGRCKFDFQIGSSKNLGYNKLMFKIISKIIPPLIFWGIFIGVVLTIPYPDSLTQANFTQIMPFFLSLYLALIFTFNLAFKNLLFSGFISFGIIFFLILKSLDSLNIVTGALTAIAIALLVSYFRKDKRYKQGSGLTKSSKIPKLRSL